jgi:DNA topoisomerase IA
MKQPCYFATSGTLAEKQKDLLRTAFEKIDQNGGEIIIATDRNLGGEEIAQELIKIAPNSAQIFRHAPELEFRLTGSN